MRRWVDAAIGNWQLKLTAFAIACLLWIGVQSGKPYHIRMANVPVRVALNDAEWVVSSAPSPATVAVDFEGPFHDVLQLAGARPVMIIPVSAVRDTAASFVLRAAWVEVPGGNPAVVVRRIRPDTTRVSFDRVATRLVTLNPRFRGKLPNGYELAGLPILDPAVVRASGGAHRLASLDTIELPMIDVSNLRANDTVRIDIDTTGIGANITPRHVDIVVPVRRKTSMTPMPPMATGQ